MQDIIKAMRVLAEEIEQESIINIAGEIYTNDRTLYSMSKAITKAADRLERESNEAGFIINMGTNDICPIQSDLKIDAKLREGQILYGLTAGSCRWISKGSWNDIIEYRVVKS